MKKLFFVAISVMALQVAQAQQKFGTAIDKEAAVKTTALTEVMGSKTNMDSVTLVGSVVDVCQAKGCWITVDVGGEKMTVKFKDYAFFMPKDCSGKQITFTGKASIKEISVAEQKHLAEDAGKSKKEIKKIKTPKKEYRFEASGVELES